MHELRRLAIAVGTLSVLLGLAYGYYQERKEQNLSAQHRYVRLLAFEGVFSPELLTRFHERSRIKVLLDTVVTLPQMQFHLKENPDSYDVIVPYLEQIQGLHQGEQLLKLSDIAGLKEIATDFQRDPHLPGEMSFAALLWGLEGILVNTEKTKPPQGFKQIFANKDLRKKLAWSNRPADVLRLLQKRGELPTGDEAAESSAQLQRALESVINFVDLRSELSFETLRSGSYPLIQASNGRAGFVVEQDPKFKYVLPEEGSQLWIMGAVIPARSPHPRWAKRFVDFLLDAKQAELLVQTSHQATTLKARWQGLPDLAHSSYLKKVPLGRVSLSETASPSQVTEIEKFLKK